MSDVTVAECLDLLCKRYGLDGNEVSDKSYLVLDAGRGIFMVADIERFCTEQETIDMGFGDIGAGITYLETQALKAKREDFYEKIAKMGNSKWFAKLIKDSLLLCKYHRGCGKEFYNLLYLRYFSETIYDDNQILDQLHMSETTYKRTKKNAIKLFGVIFWGVMLPNFRNKVNDCKDFSQCLLGCECENELEML